MSALAPTMQDFFTDRLARQRHASPETVAAYRDALRLLAGFASQRVRKQPSQLDIADLDAPLVSAFLDHLEHKRGNSVRIAADHRLRGHAASVAPGTKW
jgi:integrase/recombinase XerD